MDLTLIDQALDYLPANPWIRGGALLVAFVLLAKITDLLISRLLKAWAKRSETDLDDELIGVAHRPVFWTVLMFGLWLVLLRFDLRPEYLLILQRLIKTGAIIVWTIFAWQASQILLGAYSRLSQRSSLIQPRTVPLLDNSLKVLLTGGVAYLIFITWGINVAAWMAGAGIVGLAVGFAAKDTLANLFAGISLIVDAPYEHGDFIVIASGERGMVTKIGLRSTRILTRDDIEITVPNAVIANERIINESGGPWTKERIRIDIGVAYGSDIDEVKRLLIEEALANENVVPDPEPRVRFRTFGDSALNLQLLCWIHEPVLRGRAIDGLSIQIYNRFRREGVEIPYPKQDIYLRKMEDNEGSVAAD